VQGRGKEKAKTSSQETNVGEGVGGRGYKKIDDEFQPTNPIVNNIRVDGGI
jgi:hypothetical protein